MANIARLYYLTTTLLLGIAFVFLLIFMGTDIYYNHVKDCRTFLISTISSGGLNILLGAYMIIYFLTKSCLEILGENRSSILLGEWWQFMLMVLYIGIDVWNAYNCFMFISEPDECAVDYRENYRNFWIFSIIISANFCFNAFVVVCHCIYKTICCVSDNKYQEMQDKTRTIS